jgi:hypothetical protein
LEEENQDYQLDDYQPNDLEGGRAYLSNNYQPDYWGPIYQKESKLNEEAPVETEKFVKIENPAEITKESGVLQIYSIIC